jgi:hypothetical protein
VGRSVDAAKLGYLKFMGWSQPINASGFKAMVDFISHAQKGENILNKTEKALFHSGKIVLPTQIIPDQKQRDKLSKYVEKINEKRKSKYNLEFKTGKYCLFINEKI